jgi:hypothetical protein
MSRLPEPLPGNSSAAFVPVGRVMNDLYPSSRTDLFSVMAPLSGAILRGCSSTLADAHRHFGKMNPLRGAGL